MDEATARRAAAEWSRKLKKERIPHLVFGSVAMLLHGLNNVRKDYKDVDFLVPVNNVDQVDRLLRGSQFTPGYHDIYCWGGEGVGVSHPNSHPGLPDPEDDSIGTDRGGVRVLTLDGLTNVKMQAVQDHMNYMMKPNWKRKHRKAALESLRDFCALCDYRDAQNRRS